MVDHHIRETTAILFVYLKSWEYVTNLILLGSEHHFMHVCALLRYLKYLDQLAAPSATPFAEDQVCETHRASLKPNPRNDAVARQAEALPRRMQLCACAKYIRRGGGVEERAVTDPASSRGSWRGGR